MGFEWHRTLIIKRRIYYTRPQKHKRFVAIDRHTFSLQSLGDLVGEVAVNVLVQQLPRGDVRLATGPDSIKLHRLIEYHIED